MSRCETTTGLFSDYYDGGLSPVERQSLEEHLRGCESCRVEYEQYTRSLQALHDTAPLETTQIFLTNVRAAAQHEIERRELYLRTGIEGPRPEARPGAPGWVPWMLAAVTLAAFGAGYLSSGRGSDREVAELRALLEKELAQRPLLPPEVEPPPRPPKDEKTLLGEHGLVERDGRWIPREYDEGFRAGKVYLGPGKAVPREEAARVLREEFPPPLPPVTPPKPAETVEREVFEKYGLERHGETVVPKKWLARWAEGEVLTGVDTWRKPSEFEEAFVKKHDLVEKGGRLMSRRESEEIAARQLVRRPEAATAANNAVTAALEGLRIGAPVTSGGLTLYPLISANPGPEAAFQTLHAAIEGGKLVLADKDSFFAAQVRNDLDADVFFLAGQVLQGGRCERVVAADTLVPRRKGGAVPVLCVEPGAWKSGEAMFAKESGHYVVPPALRRALVGGQGQGAMWALLAKGSDKGAGGLAALFRRNSGKLLEYRDSFGDLADREAGTVGMAVAVGDSVEMAELFQGQALFRSYAERLARGAAIEALRRPADPAWRPAPAFPNSVRGVKQFLESAFTCGFEAREGGLDLLRGDACVGRAFVTAAGLQHAVLFSPGAVEWERRAAAPVPKEKLARVLAEYELRLADKSSGPLLKSATFREMASINAPEAVKALLGHLGEPDLAVRREVVRELGTCGDPAAVEGLLGLLKRSRKDPKAVMVFAEAARTLARIGDERAVDEFIKQTEGGDAEIARLVVQAMPDLLLQLRNREPLERGTGRLIDLYAAAEAAARGEIVGDPTTRGFDRDQARALAESARAALRQVTGLDHDRPALYQKWWNERANRDRFLRERTGR